MKIGVISDTHGDRETICQIVKLVTDVELWLHAGDCSQDAEYLASRVLVPVFSVRGNCDGHTRVKLDEFIDIAGHKIWLTHGHRYHAKQGIHELAKWGKQYEVEVVVYGHSHIADCHWDEGIFFFNPGSAYGKYATYGIIEIDDDGHVTGSIVPVN